MNSVGVMVQLQDAHCCTCYSLGACATWTSDVVSSVHSYAAVRSPGGSRAVVCHVPALFLMEGVNMGCFTLPLLL